MRFFDFLRKWGAIPKEAEGAIIFDASEIASELDRVQRAEPGSYPRESYGICAPPFRDRYFWIEAITKIDPENYENPGDLADMQDLGFEPEEVLRRVKESKDNEVARGALCIARDYRESEPGRRYREAGEDYDNGRWILEVFGYSAVYKPGELTPRNLIPLSARAFVIIGRDGTLLSDPENTLIEPYEPDPEARLLSAHGLSNMLPFTLLALSFLHKRTEVEYITPNRLERKRAARSLGNKRGAEALRDYYMIRIKPHIERDSPITDISQIRPLGAPKGGDKRTHSVRGNFRRVPDSGLFGRGYNSGELIWIPDHMRGEGALGEVSKGYKISKE